MTEQLTLPGVQPAEPTPEPETKLKVSADHTSKTVTVVYGDVEFTVPLNEWSRAVARPVK